MIRKALRKLTEELIQIVSNARIPTRGIFKFLFFLWTGCLFSQSLSPKPDPEGTRFFYRHTNAFQLKSVSIAGSFTGWKAGEFLFRFDAAQNYWTGVIKLEPGREYHYKFVLNDTLWITDPNAPFVTEDEWQNGVISPIPYGKPYISDINPAPGQRITKLQKISFSLSGFAGPVVPASVSLSLNETAVTFSLKGNWLTAEMPKDLPDGEHDIRVSFMDSAGNNSGEIISRFFLDRYTLPVASPGFYDSAIIYEIYIRKFADSDGDGIGDFRGLTSRLSYLTDTLGINTLWLMPWNESTTEHGYNVSDYYSIEQDYGTFDDYREFLKESKKRNVKVIMDFVINHTDSTHPFFLDAYKNPASKYSPWYQFINNENSDWAHFGVERKMPKLDFNHKPVGDYFFEVAKFWIDLNGDGNFDDGVDGFRCDAAKEVPHKYWAEFRKYIKGINPDILLLGEVWDNINYLIPFYKNEFDMLFDYPLYYGMQRYFGSNNNDKFIELLEAYQEVFPQGFQTVRFFSNHDNQRPINFFSGDINKLKQGLFLTYILPGTPMIYYGDELMYSGIMPPENVRNPFDWKILLDSLRYEGPIVHFYKELNTVRKTHHVLSARHDAKQLSLTATTNDDKNVLVIFRYAGSDIYMAIVNNSDVDYKDLKIPTGKIPEYKLKSGSHPVRIMGEGIASDRFRGLRFPGLTYKDNFLHLSDVYIDKGGFILFKLHNK